VITMIRPFRTLILLILAFAAGIGFDRIKQAERCRDAGGILKAELCTGENQ